MKQTAVEWLFNQIKKSSEKKDNINNDHLFFYRMLEQAKTIEKEQMFDYIKNNYVIGENSLKFHKDEFEQYYNETYKTKL